MLGIQEQSEAGALLGANHTVEGHMKIDEPAE